MRWIAITMALCTFLSCKQSRQDSLKPNIEIEERVVDFDLDQIIERGYLIALMDNSSTGLFLYKGKTMGYEYELLEKFTDKHGIGLRVEIVPNLEQAFEMLNDGRGDIMAYNLTVTKERRERIKFTHYHNLVRQVLVQKKPDDWRDMKLHEIENYLLRDLVNLIGKEVHVRYQTSYVDRLHNLSEELGGDIIIVEEDPELETEAIIKKVAQGEIEYTVAEEDVAAVNASYYPILDIEVPVSFPQQIAWGIRKNSDSLQQVLNDWIIAMRKTADYYVIYDKYFKSSRIKRFHRSEFSSLGGGEISPYDELIKQAAEKLGWDWKLLASQVFRESKFDPDAVSWVGAVGLMQVLPTTGAEYGVTKLEDPEQNLQAAVAHLQWLQNMWLEEVSDRAERRKFILASYNVGHGHVFDAVRLAEKYGEDPENWSAVSEFLLKKSDPEFYLDSVVQYGYCRGSEPINYVRDIHQTYDNYKTLLAEEEIELPLP